MKKMLLTGGNGDLAVYLKSYFEDKFIIDTPSKKHLDVSSIESVESYFANRAYDIVVNLAGTLHSSSILESNASLWIRDINVNLIGTYLVCKEAISKNSNSFLINISSTAAFNSYNDWSSYCASKAGVLKVSSALFKDNYNVVTLCPGAIDTKFRDELNIINPNVMSIEEGAKPIIDAIEGVYDSGDVIFYRKGITKKIIDHD